jgi:hypothetical protein
MEQFVLANPTDENMFRSIVLFGRNVASYKFALATALMGFAQQGQDVVPLTDLAEPYVHALCAHLKIAPKQVTSSKSRFLSECVRFNESKIGIDELLDITTRLGFQNVIDAFHRVGTSDVPVRFFLDQRKSSNPSIVITDNLISLASKSATTALQETESRWRLVETAWELGTTTAVIGFDAKTGNLILPVKRKAITSARSALNGYQKGLCFYCYQKIVIVVGEQNLADVDHLFPHALEKNGLAKNLDGIWNLVLACQSCNRGANGKFDSTPHPKYVERLHMRNEYLILSHHPLRETLIKQMGVSTQVRQQFLQIHLDIAASYRPVHWETPPMGLAAF